MNPLKESKKLENIFSMISGGSLILSTGFLKNIYEHIDGNLSNNYSENLTMFGISLFVAGASGFFSRKNIMIILN